MLTNPVDSCPSESTLAKGGSCVVVSAVQIKILSGSEAKKHIAIQRDGVRLQLASPKGKRYAY